jgi:hypothetical protein
MAFSGMLRSVALVRIDFSEELRSLRRLLATPSVVPSSTFLVTLIKEALSSFETSVLTKATGRSIPEDAILRTNPHQFLDEDIRETCIQRQRTRSHDERL